MWSDRYYYLNIYKDEFLSAYTDTGELIEFISSIPELENNGKFSFKNMEPFPFTDLVLLNAKSPRHWSSKHTSSKITNMVAIVCAKGEKIDFKEIKRVFTSIATFLNWTLVDEQTDDGIENHIIWKPQ